MFKMSMLTLASISITTVQADAGTLQQELRRLADRVEQLESANQALQARLGLQARGGGATVQNQELATRVADMENAVLALRKKPDPMTAFDGISAGASLVMVAQKATGGAKATELNARADIEVELPVGAIGDAEGKLFGHFRAGDGEGVDGAIGAFAPVNSMVFGDINSPVLMQAWYQMDFPVGAASGDLGRVEVTLGKIDPFGFFDGNNIADDESEQFLNLAFIHNPLLDAGGDIGVGEHGASPGVRLSYISDINGSPSWSASLGLFGAGEGADYVDAFDDPLVIGQVEYAGKMIGGLEGAYRLYAWSNGSAVDLSDAKERHNGWGGSLDQQVAEGITVFSRLGFSTKGEVNFDRAVTLGAQLDGGLWGRESDRIGLAAGWLEASNESGLTGTEQPMELYYVWQINDNVHVSPSLQWIREPGGDNSADSVTVWGLRAKASF